MTVQPAVQSVPESAWFKSSYSSGEGGQCVETAAVAEGLYVRDSKAPTGPIVAVSHRAWSGFVRITSTRPA